MRLTKQHIQAIKQTAGRFLQDYPDATLWLFGSRLNDQAKGGDVDFCLLLPEANIVKRAAIKRQLRPALEDTLDIPSDLVVQNSESSLKFVVKEALRQGVRLYP